MAYYDEEELSIPALSALPAPLKPIKPAGNNAEDDWEYSDVKPANEDPNDWEYSDIAQPEKKTTWGDIGREALGTVSHLPQAFARGTANIFGSAIPEFAGTISSLVGADESAKNLNEFAAKNADFTDKTFGERQSRPLLFTEHNEKQSLLDAYRSGNMSGAQVAASLPGAALESVAENLLPFGLETKLTTMATVKGLPFAGKIIANYSDDAARLMARGAEKWAQKEALSAAKAALGKGASSEAINSAAKASYEALARGGEDVLRNAYLAKKGVTAGIIGGSWMVEAGNNALDEYKRTGVVPDPIAPLVTGLASGYIETVGGNIKVLEKIVGGKAVNTVKNLMKEAAETSDPNIVKNIASTLAKYVGAVLKQGGGEAAQEFSQEFLSDTSRAINDPSFGLMTMENLKGWAEAAAQGAVTAPFSAVGEIVGDRKKSAIPKPPPTPIMQPGEARPVQTGTSDLLQTFQEKAPVSTAALAQERQQQPNPLRPAPTPTQSPASVPYSRQYQQERIDLLNRNADVAQMEDIVSQVEREGLQQADQQTMANLQQDLVARGLAPAPPSRQLGDAGYADLNRQIEEQLAQVFAPTARTSEVGGGLERQMVDENGRALTQAEQYARMKEDLGRQSALPPGGQPNLIAPTFENAPVRGQGASTLTAPESRQQQIPLPPGVGVGRVGQEPIPQTTVPAPLQSAQPTPQKAAQQASKPIISAQQEAPAPPIAPRQEIAPEEANKAQFLRPDGTPKSGPPKVMQLDDNIKHSMDLVEEAISVKNPTVAKVQGLGKAIENARQGKPISAKAYANIVAAARAVEAEKATPVERKYTDEDVVYKLDKNGHAIERTGGYVVIAEHADGSATLSPRAGGKDVHFTKEQLAQTQKKNVSEVLQSEQNKEMAAERKGAGLVNARQYIINRGGVKLSNWELSNYAQDSKISNLVGGGKIGMDKLAQELGIDTEDLWDAVVNNGDIVSPEGVKAKKRKLSTKEKKLQALKEKAAQQKIALPQAEMPTGTVEPTAKQETGMTDLERAAKGIKDEQQDSFNFGVNADFMGMQTSYELLVKAAKAAGNKFDEYYPHLVTIGRKLIGEGKTRLQDFRKGMREVLGDAWGKFKGLVMKVWNAAKKEQKSESPMFSPAKEQITDASNVTKTPAEIISEFGQAAVDAVTELKSSLRSKSRISPENMAKIDRISNAHISESRTVEGEIMEAMSKIVGKNKDVVVVDSNGMFDGVMAVGGKIFVDKNASKPLYRVFAHEMFHANNDLHKRKLMRVLQGLVDPKKYQEWVKNRRATMEKQGLGNLSDIDALEEFSADFLSDQMTSPEFWSRLAERESGTFRKMVEWVVDKLKAIGIDLEGYGYYFSHPDKMAAAVRGAERFVVARIRKVPGGVSKDDLMHMSRLFGHDSEKFWPKVSEKNKFLSGSVVQDVVYHGTNADKNIFTFRNPIGWFSKTPAVANLFTAGGRKNYAEMRDKAVEPTAGGNIMPSYISLKKPFDAVGGKYGVFEMITADKMAEKLGITKDELGNMIADNMEGMDDPAYNIVSGHWQHIPSMYDWLDSYGFIKTLQKLGYDGIVSKEMLDHGMGEATYGVFSPDQIKSATGNTGAFGQRIPTEAEANALGMSQEEAMAAQTKGDVRFSPVGEDGTESNLFTTANQQSPLTEQNGETQLQSNPYEFTDGKFSNMPKAFKRWYTRKDMGWIRKYMSNPWWNAQKFGEKAKNVLNIALNRKDKRAMLQHELLGTMDRAIADMHSRDKDGNYVNNKFMQLASDDKKAMERVTGILVEGDQLGKVFNDEELEQRGISKGSKEYEAYFDARKAMDHALAVRIASIRTQILAPYREKAWYDDLKAVFDGQDVAISAANRIENQKERGDFLAAVKQTNNPRKKLELFRRRMAKVEGYFPRVRGEGDQLIRVYDKVTGELIALDRRSGDVSAQLRANEFKKEYPEGNVEVLYDPKPSGGTFSGVNQRSIEALVKRTMEKMENGGTLSPEESAEITDMMLRDISETLIERGWGKHQIKRKMGDIVQGYETKRGDKVFSDYMIQLAGLVTKQEAAFEFARALSKFNKTVPVDDKGRPIGESELKAFEYWNKYAQDMLRSDEDMDRKFATVRGLAFGWYIAGRISAAAVQATQNFVTAIPFMAEKLQGADKIFGAEKRYLTAALDIARKNMTPDEKAFITDAIDKGATIDQNMREMMRGVDTTTPGWLYNALESAGAPFSAMESTNRKMALLAMYRLAKEQGATVEEGQKFSMEAAEQAIEFMNNTHYLMGKENLPDFARGTSAANQVARTAMTFRSFTHNYILSMADAIGRKEFGTVLRSMAYLAAFGGAGSLPLWDWILELFEKKDGVPYRANAMKAIEKTFGKTAQNLYSAGIPGAAAGIDISGSLKMGMPTDPSEMVYGVYGGLAKKATNAAKLASRGDYLRAAESASPVFIENILRSRREAKYGATNVSGMPLLGNTGKQIKPDVTSHLKRALGFRPLDVSESSTERRSVDVAKQGMDERKSKIYDMYRIAYNNKDEEGKKEAKEMARQFNRDLIASKSKVTPKIDVGNMSAMARSHYKLQKQYKGLD